jgi:ABC-2 type transport system permease protein
MTASNAVWRQYPVFWLTMRQFVAGRSLRLVTLLAAAPLLIGGINYIRIRGEIGADTLNGIFLFLTTPTIVPIATLVLATSAIANELSDRTMPYLMLKPVSWIRVALEKITASFLMTAAVVAVMGWVLWILVGVVGETPNLRVLSAMLIATVCGVAAYTVVFSLLSLVVSRVLLAGLIYALVWENLVARFIPGVRLLSIRHYTQSIYTGVLNDPSVSISQQTELTSALAVLAVTVVLSVALVWIRLRRMDLD